MNRVFAVIRAILAQFELSLCVFAVFCSCIILPLALCALKCDDLNSTFLFATHDLYS
jgi:hypothetical protein